MHVDLRRRGLQSFDPAEFASTDEHLQLLLQVRQLDLSHNSLYTIRGLEGLTHLTVLSIAHNGLRTLGGGLPLTLRELDASHNSLVSLQNAALLPLVSLVSLNVSFNELEDLRGVPSATAQLAHLDVRSNRLTSLIGIEHCSELRTLHAEANLLRDVADVASLRSVPQLQAIFLAGNPLLLRKRRLHALQQLLPTGLEQDDLPVTAPPSSIHSSTAAPPSVVDTSLMGSMEHSTNLSVGGEARDEARSCGGRRGGSGGVVGGQPPSTHSSCALSLLNSTAGVADDSSRVTAAERSVASTHRQAQPPRHDGPQQQQRQQQQQHQSHDAGSMNETLLSVTVQSTPPTADPVTAPQGGSPPGVVGCEADSPSCARRALPHEHRLSDSLASPSSSPARGRHQQEHHQQQQRHHDPYPRDHETHTPSAASFSSIGKSRGAGMERRSTATSVTHPTALPPALPLSRASRLTADELEERLARVTAERDSFGREVQTLREELRELRQLCMRHWEQEGKKMASTATAQMGWRVPAAGGSQACLAAEPPSHLLAVEMSAQESSVDSLGGDDCERTALSTRNGGVRVGPGTSLDASAAAAAGPAVLVPALHASTTSSINGGGGAEPATVKFDRREMAALFMSALQKRGATA